MAPCVEVELDLSRWVHYRNLAFPQYKYYWLSFLSRVVPADILLEVKLFLPFKSKGCCNHQLLRHARAAIKAKRQVQGKLQGLWTVGTPTSHTTSVTTPLIRNLLKYGNGMGMGVSLLEVPGERDPVWQRDSSQPRKAILSRYPASQLIYYGVSKIGIPQKDGL